MESHSQRQIEICPRCRNRFACGKRSALPGTSFRCACQNIHLTQEETRWLQTLAQNECFCLNCLRELQAEFRMRSEQEKS